LAHLADHKEHGNRYRTDLVTAAEKSTPPLFGLYTCLSNTVYTPVSLIKPTDFVGTIRSLLIRLTFFHAKVMSNFKCFQFIPVQLGKFLNCHSNYALLQLSTKKPDNIDNIFTYLIAAILPLKVQSNVWLSSHRAAFGIVSFPEESGASWIRACEPRLPSCKRIFRVHGRLIHLPAQ
jgi:hypothetical protein